MKHAQRGCKRGRSQRQRNYTKCKFCIIEGIEKGCFQVLFVVLTAFWSIYGLLFLFYAINKSNTSTKDIAFNILVVAVLTILPFRWRNDKRFCNHRFHGNKFPNLQVLCKAQFCSAVLYYPAGAVVRLFEPAYNFWKQSVICFANAPQRSCLSRWRTVAR